MCLFKCTRKSLSSGNESLCWFHPVLLKSLLFGFLHCVISMFSVKVAVTCNIMDLMITYKLIFLRSFLKRGFRWKERLRGKHTGLREHRDKGMGACCRVCKVCKKHIWS